MPPSYRKFVLIFLAIILAAGGGYFVWDRFFSVMGKERRFAAEQERTYREAEKKYLEAMKADNYGGKTPKETLDLFVAALRAGDVDLASKYFLIRPEVPREEWVAYLNAVKEKGMLARMAEDMSKQAIPDNKSIIDEDDYKFILFKSDGVVGVHVDMRFNSYTEVWKIEGLF